MRRKSLFSSFKVQYLFSTISRVPEATSVKLARDINILYLGTDSRNISHPSQTLFFAIKSKSGDGHKYLEECYARGVRSFVLEHRESAYELKSDCNYILVKSSLQALQEIATWHRKQFNIPVVGITGSNGKTIVKEWLSQLLEEKYRICKSPKSYNSQIGVPLSVWQLNSQHTMGIFEAGISERDEMENLQKIILPTIGIFTNIGTAHQVNFNSLEEKKNEKMKLFASAQKIISKYEDIVAGNEEKNFTWGKNENADIIILSEIISDGKSIVSIAIKSEIRESPIYNINIPFSDRASVENIMHCYAIMNFLGYKHDEIQKGISNLHPVEMRLEIKAGINQCTIINDSYNSDPASLSIALDVLNQQQQHSRKTLILSDIFESGRNEEELYSELAGIISGKGVTHLIGIGEAIGRQKNKFNSGSEFYKSTELFLQKLKRDAFSNEAILLKGSRVFGFERIAQRLQQKAHSTVMEINLNALIHNLNVYRTYLKPEVKVMAMVKASSYGSGAHEIANALQHHKVDYLAVAYADEGVYLRQNGLRIPIMVMNPEESAFETMALNKLEPEIYSFKLFNQYINFIRSGFGKAYPIHLKIDTGMHRLGFEESQLDDLIKGLRENKFLQVKSIFTHLASTDVPEHDDFTKKQISIFRNAFSKIENALSYTTLKHALNSAGTTRFIDSQFDMVRLGIGLYGIDPTPDIQQQLEVVSSLKTHISQIKHIPSGESIGYSRKGIAHGDTVIATIEIGYADGFSRILGNGNGKVLVNGKEAPLIGNVCMDMCMIDITNIHAQEGDEVIIFNKDYPVELMSQRMGTIPYEVLTNISQRVKRVYYRE